MTPKGNLRVALLVAAVAFVCFSWLSRREEGGGPWGEPAPWSPSTDFASLTPEQQALELAAVIRIQERNQSLLFRSPGIVGTAVGLTESGLPAIQVYVTGGGLPLLPSMLDGVPVVVREAGPFIAYQELPARVQGPASGDRSGEAAIDRYGRFTRPVPIGVSTGHPSATAGTIGALVTDGALLYALSNHHVYAAGTDARIGDDLLQPGRVDGGLAPADVIGTLAAFEPIRFSLMANNRIDAALAVTTQVDARTPGDGYGAPRSPPLKALPGMKAKKYGRTTGLTTGRVDAINATVNVRYANDVARFTGQIIFCCSMSAGGDSGSLIVRDDVDADGNEGSEDRRPIALLFAGDGRMTIASPIGEVLDAFGVRIVGDDR